MAGKISPLGGSHSKILEVTYMYQIGDRVIYGGTGVCEVTELTTRYLPETGKEQRYYVLKPLYQKCTILTPVHATKVFMRPILSKEEADRLIDSIPDIRAEAYHGCTLNKLAEHYRLALNAHECSDLVELTMSIYAKKREAARQKRKFGAVDEKFMKRAEELLFGELAAALGVPREEVPEYIAERVDGKKNGGGDSAL